MHSSVIIFNYAIYPYLSDLEVKAVAFALNNNASLEEAIDICKLPELVFDDQIQLNQLPSVPVLKMGQKAHVDSFFNEGLIQLGTFEYFNRFDHEEIGDKSEGYFLLVGRNANITSFTKIGGGYNNYAFCTYLGEYDQECMNRFGYNSCFEISDPLDFSKAIQKIIEATDFAFAPCIYSKDKVIVGKPDEQFNFGEISSNLMQLTNKVKFFVKPNHLSHQSEFRFVWSLRSDAGGPIIIKCPEAVKYCRRIL